MAPDLANTADDHHAEIQAHQFQVAPYGGVTNRSIACLDTVVELLNGNMTTRLKKGAENQLPLSRHLETFCF